MTALESVCCKAQYNTVAISKTYSACVGGKICSWLKRATGLTQKDRDSSDMIIHVEGQRVMVGLKSQLVVHNVP